MFALLVFSSIFAVATSAICSLAEATLYAVPIALVRHWADNGRRSGVILLKLKENIERPISAILIMNTVANTAGASIAGWAYGQLYGDLYGELGLLIFSSGFILSILLFSEITPKVLGVTYCKAIAPYLAFPINFLVSVLAIPLKLTEKLMAKIKPQNGAPGVSQEEILSQVMVGTEEGALDQFEGSVIQNVVTLDQVLIRDILTPRVVVFRLPETTVIESLRNEILAWSHSRVPVFREDDPDHLTGYVLQRDIFRELLRGNGSAQLSEIARPLPVVPELIRADRLILKMFAERSQICSVVDEHGGLSGIITLEDILEEIVGQEIVDEYDTVSDLRTFARILRVAKARKLASN